MNRAPAAALVAHAAANVPRTALSWAVAGVGAVAALAYLTVPATQDAIFTAAGFGAALAVVGGIWLQRPERLLSWALVAAGLAFFAAADLAWILIPETAAGPPFPSWADPLYLAGYLSIAAGLVLMARAQGLRSDSVVDALVVTASLTAVVWLGIVLPLLEPSDATILARAVALAHPLASLALLATAVLLLLARGVGCTCARLLALGLLSQLLGDALYAGSAVAATYSDGGWLDLTWLAAYVLIGASALHPTMTDIAAPRRTGREPLSSRRFLLLISAALAVPLADALGGIEPDSAVDAATVMVILLVAGRLAGPVKALAHSARRDELTGLPNRSLLSERLDTALSSRSRRQRGIAVLMCDLDHFKVVNDGLGHQAGDRLLLEVAQRMQRSVRASDTVARLGGDEFVVLLEDCDEEQVGIVSARIIAAVAERVVLPDGGELSPSMSVGLAVANSTCTAEEMLRDADTALYRAKDRGRGRIERFDEHLRAEVVERLSLEADLRTALAGDELFCVHQQERELVGGGLFGLESLVRWNHPTRGLLGPDRFITIAEDSGLIDLLFDRVLRLTLQAQRDWAQQLGYHPTVAVNVSPRQLADGSLPGRVATAMSEAGTPPSSLWLEVTETATASLDDFSTLHELKRLGIQLAVDDFGTGWSSLSRLSNFGWDALKIDRSFVSRLGPDEQANHVVRAMIAMAHALGMVSIAEGVESRVQETQLLRAGCDIVQGHFYGRPVPAHEVVGQLARARADASTSGA